MNRLLWFVFLLLHGSGLHRLKRESLRVRFYRSMESRYRESLSWLWLEGFRTVERN